MKKPPNKLKQTIALRAKRRAAKKCALKFPPKQGAPDRRRPAGSR